ncbi:hypothetical protein H5P28_07075 [Ruficoccus amylovorans]|uniref:Uncharacterized protein n=1 Tax=Ruficoccus amylovorans TaxID=1804625 RepID=A0A842HFE4_9BACT|nr:hypothetical protein [Ruficoccus amylovorans]MBC2594021.1 hypothetical protein [Ruficoccus amylovorans]
MNTTDETKALQKALLAHGFYMPTPTAQILHGWRLIVSDGGLVFRASFTCEPQFLDHYARQLRNACGERYKVVRSGRRLIVRRILKGKATA